MPDIEPAVIPIRYDVSCLPEGHPDRRHFTVQLRYCGEGQWAATDIFGDEYDENGEQGVYRSNPRRRFDFDTALELAKRIAPELNVDGHSVADVLARSEGRHG